MEFFVGTITRVGGGGVLRCRLDGERIEETDSLFLTDPNYVMRVGERLFAVSGDGQGAHHGCVNEIDARGRMRILARQETHGEEPCFLCASPDGRYLYCANYITGSIAVFPIEHGLEPCVQLIEHSGSGPHPTRQTCAHVHQTLFIPGTQLLCACDLGADAIIVYRADVKTGRLVRQGALHLNGGPRHLVFAGANRAYVCHELSCEVTALRVEDGVLTPLQTLDTLPPGVQDGTVTASAIRLSADGRRLFVSNRMHGSLAVFDVGADGLLTPAGHLRAGIFPRDVALLKDGGFLAADQHAGLRLIGADGEEKQLYAHKGAVCVCCAE